ncbi:mycofactocin system transcriptional regulator [Protofrankia symbiont of Coriaria ruscifolia]|uniref:mycofactocin system transcriptional regulator n=1 Tax=Protofrankia symbiont of Coriaria ruscifolia TaxID=1306542 RepID=UPI0010416425|nr:mycofactocin system transcriptional regulator [Protofrankia symbiont of Coriaria ruscifolia]
MRNQRRDGLPGASGASGGRGGRNPITTRAELEHLAFELFAERGFDKTTVDDIARAAGIGRRTFFRYFPSKNDIVWGGFDEELTRLHANLQTYPPTVPLMDAVRQALIDFNRVDPAEAPWHRRRMQLILHTPALQAHSTLRYVAWRQVLAEFVGNRIGQAEQSLAPQAIAYATLGVAIAAYEQWLRHEDLELTELLDAAMRELAAGFAGTVEGPPAAHGG